MALGSIRRVNVTDDIDNGFGHLSDRELLIRIYSRVRSISDTQRDHEARLRALEAFRWVAVGMWTLFVLAGGWVVQWVSRTIDFSMIKK